MVMTFPVAGIPNPGSLGLPPSDLSSKTVLPATSFARTSAMLIDLLVACLEMLRLGTLVTDL